MKGGFEGGLFVRWPQSAALELDLELTKLLEGELRYRMLFGTSSSLLGILAARTVVDGLVAFPVAVDGRSYLWRSKGRAG